MPETINSLHAILTLVAAGILFSCGWQLAVSERVRGYALARAYPPRVSDSDLIVRSILEDNVPSAATLSRLTDE